MNQSIRKLVKTELGISMTVPRNTVMQPSIFSLWMSNGILTVMYHGIQRGSLITLVNQTVRHGSLGEKFSSIRYRILKQERNLLLIMDLILNVMKIIHVFAVEKVVSATLLAKISGLSYVEESLRKRRKLRLDGCYVMHPCLNKSHALRGKITAEDFSNRHPTLCRVRPTARTLWWC